MGAGFEIRRADCDDQVRTFTGSPPGGRIVNVGIFLFEQVEVLDFAGPFEVFSTAARLEARAVPGGPAPFTVTTIGCQAGKVTARGGLRVLAQYGLADHPELGVLLIPGGIVDGPIQDAQVIDWLRGIAGSVDWMASICTGAFLLAAAGLLEGQDATTHWEDLEEFEESFPGVHVKSSIRWTDNGRILTSAGISAGIDMCLHLLTRIAGEDLALATARQMDYRWSPDQD